MHGSLDLLLRIITQRSSESADGEKDPMKLKDYVWDKLVRYHAWWGFDLVNDKFTRFSLWMTLVTGIALVIVLFVL